MSSLVAALCLVFSLGLLYATSASLPPEGRLDFHSCEADVAEWTEIQMAEAEELKWQMLEREEAGGPRMPDTIFFLHIARAGGRTYHQCFLSSLMPSNVQCNMSYHYDRNDPGESPPCRLLATHDDYSMTHRLPAGTATGVTSLFREPADRVLSTYEFTIHICARSMGLDLSTLPDETLFDGRRSMREQYTRLVPTDTRNVWPWRLLALAMEEDMWTRRDFTTIPPPPVGFDPARVDMYSRPHLVMPVREFIELPLVFDLVHNMATFQLVGITNNSILPEALRLRRCVMKHPTLGSHLVALAKLRIDSLLHLGFTDKMDEAAQLLMAILDRSFASPAFHIPPEGSGPRHKCGGNSKRSSKSNKGSSKSKMQSPSVRQQYQSCLKDQMELTSLNNVVAFRHMGPLEFNRQERARIPKDIMKRIRELNAMDIEITEYARQVYKRKLEENKKWMEKLKDPSKDFC